MDGIKVSFRVSLYEPDGIKVSFRVSLYEPDGIKVSFRASLFYMGVIVNGWAFFIEICTQNI